MRMMPAGFLFVGGERKGKRCSRAAPNPTRTQHPGYKGRKKSTKGGRIKGQKSENKEEERETKERKKEGKRGFLQKNRILQIFVGII